jgi:hypothetical protein
MNIYKYQILKYLENQNIPIKDIKILPKEEILKLYKHVNLNDLKLYLNKRKTRNQNKIIYYPEKIKLVIDWSNVSIWI